MKTTIPTAIGSDWFPRAHPASFPAGAVRDPAPPRMPHFRERHLQCIWSDDRLRPTGLTTANGEQVRVEHPGEWNTGPGPDFLNAALRVGPELRRISGDVELHIRPADWQHHGHAGDSRYERVCVHVTYFPGPEPEGLPAGTLQIALRPALDAMPEFSFDNIDLMAYPIAARAEDPPCRPAMKQLSPQQRGTVLDRFGEARLRQRAEVLHAAMMDRGPAQVLYEETMAALGYRPNKAPFRLLARRMPLVRLRELSGGEPVRAYALLAGCASLLPDPTAKPNWDTETRAFLRRCWDAWWPLAEDGFNRRIPQSDWVRAGMRPANRPERRLMAAALLFAPCPGLPEQMEQLSRSSESGSAASLLKLLELPEAPYWSRRLSFSTPPKPDPIALIGPARAKAIWTNLLLPALAALGAPASVWNPLLNRLPAESGNQLIRSTAHRLFGRDHAPSLYRSGLRRQGLIQIHHTYCLGDRTRCAACPFPGLLETEVP